MVITTGRYGWVHKIRSTWEQLTTTSCVPGIVTMENGKGYKEHRGGPLLKNNISVRATRIVSNFSRLALLLCFPFDNVHRELQRLTTKKRCYTEEIKPTGNLY